jgi:hypothetical protein
MRMSFLSAEIYHPDVHTSTSALRSAIFRSPLSLRRLRYEAAERFMWWREVRRGLNAVLSGNTSTSTLSSARPRVLERRETVVQRNHPLPLSRSSSSRSVHAHGTEWSMERWEAEWGASLSRDISAALTLARSESYPHSAARVAMPASKIDDASDSERPAVSEPLGNTQLAAYHRRSAERDRDIRRQRIRRRRGASASSASSHRSASGSASSLGLHHSAHTPTKLSSCGDQPQPPPAWRHAYGDDSAQDLDPLHLPSLLAFGVSVLDAIRMRVFASPYAGRFAAVGGVLGFGLVAFWAGVRVGVEFGSGSVRMVVELV